ncbi:MAG: hypothetical protein IJ433_08320 [Ruminococcus sp.]|nr:hypothetical protein [Ruminococcus sp.]
MKKLLALLLSVMMIFSVTACGSTTSEDEIRGEQKTSEEAYSAGSVDGLKYESTFIGIGCNLPENWSFYTDEQIRELNNVTTDAAGEEYEKLMQDAQLVYDMYAVNNNNVDSINVNLEKVDSVTLLALDMKDYYEHSVDSIETAYTNMGATNFDYTIGKVTIDGEEFDSLDVVAEINGTKLYQTAFAKKCSGYVANITITSIDEATVKSILDSFYVV